MRIPGRKLQNNAKKALFIVAFLSFMILLSVLRPAQISQAASGVTINITIPGDYFQITNSGTAFSASYTYTLYQGSTSVDSNFVTLNGGGSTLVYPNVYGALTLRVYDETSVEVASTTYERMAPTGTPTTVPDTATPTSTSIPASTSTFTPTVTSTSVPPTSTPTSTSTFAPTATPKPSFVITSLFNGFGNVVFYVNNPGKAMSVPYRYILYESGAVREDKSFILSSGFTQLITVVGDPGNYLLNILDENTNIVDHQSLSNVTPTPTALSTSTSVSTKTPTAASNNSTINPGQTPTAKSWFWSKHTKTPTLTVTSSPTQQATPAIAKVITPTQTLTIAPMITVSTPAETAKPTRSLVWLFIAVGVLLLALIGIGLRRMFKK